MKRLDGTLLALGTVGLVAVAGAFRARGSLSTHRWVYHLTYRDNLPGIARRGLVPRADTTEAWDNEPGIYFVNNFGYEAGPGADPEYSAWLRFPAPNSVPQGFFREDSQEGRTMNTIPADAIEVLVDADGGMAMYEEDGRWVRLLDFVRGSRNTRSPVSHVSR